MHPQLPSAPAKPKPTPRRGKAALIAVLVLLVGGVAAKITDTNNAGDNGQARFEGTTALHPTITPTRTAAQIAQAYPTVADIREIVVRPGDHFGTQLTVTGTVSAIQVAPKGRIYKVGDQKTREYVDLLFITVESPSGSQEQLLLGYDGSTAGIYEGSTVTAYGTLVDTESDAKNVFGNKVSLPLIDADQVALIAS